MGRYGSETSVSVENSKVEIEKTLRRYGASAFMSGWDKKSATIAFGMNDRQIRFVLLMPDPSSDEFQKTETGRHRSAAAAEKEWEQECRQRWRALSLVIKAKLEAIESDISTFDSEFMAQIVLPNGRTVGEEVIPRIATAYKDETMPPLLPDYT